MNSRSNLESIKKSPQVTRDSPPSSQQSSQTISPENLKNGIQCKHRLLKLLNLSTSEKTLKRDKCVLSSLPPLLTPIHQGLVRAVLPHVLPFPSPSHSPHSPHSLSLPRVSQPVPRRSDLLWTLKPGPGFKDDNHPCCKALLCAQDPSSHSKLTPPHKDPWREGLLHHHLHLKWWT